MLAYPEAQSRAHAELDEVVGRERLPTFADYPHLPYIRAMVKEILRWRPAGPQAAPHRSTEDDWYEGMFIPKGTICIPNVWYMNRDPEVYGENAEHFDPGRYLDEARGEVAPGPSDAKEEGHYSYGFGRRGCIGRHMANNSLFINMAIMLWATKLERKKDSSGRLLPLDVDGFVDHGVVVSVVITLIILGLDADMGASTDVRSPLSVKSLRVSRKPLPCFFRNARCGLCENQDIYIKARIEGLACEIVRQIRV